MIFFFWVLRWLLFDGWRWCVMVVLNCWFWMLWLVFVNLLLMCWLWRWLWCVSDLGCFVCCWVGEWWWMCVFGFWFRSGWMLWVWFCVFCCCCCVLIMVLWLWCLEYGLLWRGMYFCCLSLGLILCCLLLWFRLEIWEYDLYVWYIFGFVCFVDFFGVVCFVCFVSGIWRFGIFVIRFLCLVGVCVICFVGCLCCFVWNFGCLCFGIVY